MVTTFGIAAFLLSPVGLIYWAIRIRGDAAARRWGMIGLGSLCALQSLVGMIYFGVLFSSFPHGLGV